MSYLPKIALQRLHAKSAPAGAHPDPNLISAFAENSLPREARAQVMQHLAQCADCREVVFLSTPDQAATSPAPASAPSAWLSWPVLRWGTAVAAIVVVAAAVGLHRPSGKDSTLSNAASTTDVSVAKEKAASARPSEEKQNDAVAKAAPAAPVVVNSAVAGAEYRPPDQLKKQSAGVAASLAQNSGAMAGDLTDQRRDELDKTPTVAATAQSANVDSAQVVPGRAKDAAAEPAANAGAGIGGGIGLNTGSAARTGPLLFAPMVAPRWTLTSDGTLQRSFDLGRSWQTIQVSSQASFRALAANGKDIWVGGAKGALYHSSDAGRNWAQVQPVAAGQTLTDDIIGVEFPDLLNGKLTTANKETWTTADGGQTWRKP
jgi:hypothetical protein